MEPSWADTLRKYELPVLGIAGLLLIVILQKVTANGYYVPVVGIVALAIFLYLTRYIIEPTARTRALNSGIAAGTSLALLTAAQILFLTSISKSNPSAGLVNLGLSGLFVTTVLYLYLLSVGMDVISNYARRFNKNYRDVKKPRVVNALLLLAYVVAAAKYLLVLYMLKITE